MKKHHTKRRRSASRKAKRRSRKQRGGVRVDLKQPPKSLEIKRVGDPADDVDTLFQLVSESEPSTQSSFY